MRKGKSRLTFRQIVTFVGLLFFPLSANASDYPNKLIKLIVTVAPGGPTDVLARTLADAMSVELGQPVVVENRTGGGGIPAYGAVASAAPDGYTLAFVDPSITVNPSLHDNIPYSVEKDLTPISTVVHSTPVVLTTRKGLSANNVLELIALAKSNPGKLTYGSAGTGTPPHMNAELFKTAQGLDVIHVPYRGAAPVLADMLAERIDMVFLNIGTSRPQIEAGSLKGLAVGGTKRATMLRNIPTFYEAGLSMPQLDAGTWWGVMAPAKLPDDIQRKLNEVIVKALNSPQVRKRFEEMSVDPQASTAQEFGELILGELRKWADLVKKAKIKQE